VLLYSNTTFRVTFVKLYFIPNVQIDSIVVKLASEKLISDKLANKLSKELASLLIKRSKGQLYKNLDIIVFLQNNNKYKVSC
jgi:hypothetical protein